MDNEQTTEVELLLLADALAMPVTQAETIEDQDALNEEDGIEEPFVFNVYAEIKAQLVRRGVDPAHIAFIQDYNTKTRRAALFAAMNRGDIRVLVLSKQSTGINVQQRLIALHNLDVPWRPGDVEQRIGRIERQGNVWPEIYVFNHATEASLDGYMWQSIHTKAGFINQFESGDVTTREIDDIGGAMTITAAEMRAISSGNPAIIQKMKLENEIARLDISFASYRDEVLRMRRSFVEIVRRREEYRETLRRWIQVGQIVDAHPHGEDKFKVAVITAFNDHEGRILTNREEAGAAIRVIVEEGFSLLKAAHQEAVNAVKAKPIFGKASQSLTTLYIEPIQYERTVASYRGLFVQFWLQITQMGDVQYRLQLKYKDGDMMRPLSNSYIATSTDKGVFQSIDSMVREVENHQKEAQKNIHLMDAEEVAVTTALTLPWEFEQSYATCRAELRRVNASLGINDGSEEGSEQAPLDEPVTSAPRRRRSLLLASMLRYSSGGNVLLRKHQQWYSQWHQQFVMVYPEIIIPPPSDPAAMDAARQKLLAMDAARSILKAPEVQVKPVVDQAEAPVETITLDAEDVILPDAVITPEPAPAEPTTVTVVTLPPASTSVEVVESGATKFTFGSVEQLEVLRTKKTKKAKLVAQPLGQLSMFDTASTTPSPTTNGGQTSIF